MPGILLLDHIFIKSVVKSRIYKLKNKPQQRVVSATRKNLRNNRKNNRLIKLNELDFY